MRSVDRNFAAAAMTAALAAAASPAASAAGPSPETARAYAALAPQVAEARTPGLAAGGQMAQRHAGPGQAGRTPMPASRPLVQQPASGRPAVVKQNPAGPSPAVAGSPRIAPAQTAVRPVRPDRNFRTDWRPYRGQADRGRHDDVRWRDHGTVIGDYRRPYYGRHGYGRYGYGRYGYGYGRYGTAGLAGYYGGYYGSGYYGTGSAVDYTDGYGVTGYPEGQAVDTTYVEPAAETVPVVGAAYSDGYATQAVETSVVDQGADAWAPTAAELAEPATVVRETVVCNGYSTLVTHTGSYGRRVYSCR